MSEVKRFRADHRHVVETEFDDAQFVGVADFDRVTAEREALQVRVNELREDFQELSEQSERRGRQASEFEERMGDLQAENGKLQDRISLLSDSGEHVESHLEKQADVLRIRCDALQTLPNAADERADVLEGLLREAMPALDLAASAFKSAMPVRSKVRTALKPAEGSNEPNCLRCLDKKTVPSNLAEGYVMDCPDCCGEEG